MKNTTFLTKIYLSVAWMFLILSSQMFAQSQTITIIKGESIADSPNNVLIQAYPNPVETELTLETVSNFELETILIYDNEGILVEEISIASNSLPVSTEVHLEPGSYNFKGSGAFFGKVNWGLALTVGIGIILIAGNGG